MAAIIDLANEQEVKVAVGIVIKNGKVLLVQRSLKEGYLNWQFPAGKLKPYERAANAVVREVYEETDVRCIMTKSIGSRRHPETGVRVFYFICDYSSGHETVKNHNEVRRVEWVSFRDVKSYVPAHMLYPKLLDFFEEQYK